MPIYEYECRSCRYRFEELQKITEDPLRRCPKCGKEKLVKLVSNTSFQLKGTGWYVTDFKDKKSKKEGEKPSGKQPETKKTEKDQKKKDQSTK